MDCLGIAVVLFKYKHKSSGAGNSDIPKRRHKFFLKENGEISQI
jgi:hypothetical protein